MRHLAFRVWIVSAITFHVFSLQVTRDEPSLEQQPVVEQPPAEQPVEQSAEEQPTEAKPVEEQSVVEQPTVEKPAEEQSAVEQPTEGKPADALSLDEWLESGDCPDVHGRYQTRHRQPVLISQRGCTVQLQIFWTVGEAVVRNGRVFNHTVQVEEFDAPGLIADNGDVYFEDGAFWIKLLSDADETEECVQIAGNYADKKNRLVAITQDGCSATIQMHWNENATTATATVARNEIQFADFAAVGHRTQSGGIQFEDGGHWRLLPAGGQDPKALSLRLHAHSDGTTGCDNVQGFYMDPNSRVVLVNQEGCNLTMSTVANNSLADRALTAGQIMGKSLLLEGQAGSGTFGDLGHLHFEDGRDWVRLEPDPESQDLCMAPGYLVHLHVSKTGGTSVDQYLSCQCDKLGCAHALNLGSFQKTHGKKSCSAAAICSTDGRYRERDAQCGQEFANVQRIFTSMRDPVKRVLSVYHDENQKSKLPPLADLYKKCDNPGNSTSAAEMSMCEQLVNHMTLQTFSRQERKFNTPLDVDVLNEAKDVVKGLDAIFMLEDFDIFPDMFLASGLMPTSPEREDCHFKHANPTLCAECAELPTPDEVQLIRHHNAMDAALYEYAQGLPNRVRRSAV